MYRIVIAWAILLLLLGCQNIVRGIGEGGISEDSEKVTQADPNPGNEIQKLNLSSQEASTDLVNKLNALEKSLQNFEKATEAD